MIPLYCLYREYVQAGYNGAARRPRPSAFIRLQARLDALVVEELFHALLATAFGVEQARLIKLGVEVILVLLPGQFAAALEAMLGRTQHHRVFLQQVARQFNGYFAQLSQRHAFVDQAHFRGFLPAKGLAGHDVVQRLAMAHGVGHGLAHQVARRDAPVDFREAEGRFVGADRQVTGHQRAEATAEAPAIDHGDGGFGVHAQQFPLPLRGFATDFFLKDFRASDIEMDGEGRRCVFWQNTLLPFQPLSELLSYNRQLSRGSFYTGKQEQDSFSIVILRGGNNLLAVQVDQVIGELEIVIKQIEGPIPKTAGIAGATVLGDGTVMPIGDVLELIDIARGRLRTDNGSPWRQLPPPVEVEISQKSEAMVLIVDDSITVRELLSLSFSKAGYRVEQARDGQEAWEKLRGGLPCDIVFCDIEMPRMNGLELLSNLQKDPRLASIPVALLTSRGAERHRKMAATLGASGYFTKPYTERDLLSAAERMIAGEVLLANSIKETLNQPLSPDTTTIDSNLPNFWEQSSPLVLIVDDSVTVREMLAISLLKAGYRIEQARDGLEAWEKLRDGLACDLILCDIEMPRLNGLELLSRLQGDEQLQGIPVAMITSRGSQKMQHLAAAKGAKGYFVKPYIEDVLLSAAQRLIAGEVLIQKENSVD